MPFTQEVDKVASNWKRYLVAAAVGAVTVLIIIGVVKFIL